MFYMMSPANWGLWTRQVVFGKHTCHDGLDICFVCISFTFFTIRMVSLCFIFIRLSHVLIVPISPPPSPPLLVSRFCPVTVGPSWGANLVFGTEYTLLWLPRRRPWAPCRPPSTLPQLVRPLPWLVGCCPHLCFHPLLPVRILRPGLVLKGGGCDI